MKPHGKTVDCNDARVPSTVCINCYNVKIANPFQVAALGADWSGFPLFWPGQSVKKYGYVRPNIRLCSAEHLTIDCQKTWKSWLNALEPQEKHLMQSYLVKYTILDGVESTPVQRHVVAPYWHLYDIERETVIKDKIEISKSSHIFLLVVLPIVII